MHFNFSHAINHRKTNRIIKVLFQIRAQVLKYQIKQKICRMQCDTKGNKPHWRALKIDWYAALWFLVTKTDPGVLHFLNFFFLIIKIIIIIIIVVVVGEGRVIFYCIVYKIHINKYYKLFLYFIQWNPLVMLLWNTLYGILFFLWFKSDIQREIP